MRVEVEDIIEEAFRMREKMYSERDRECQKEMSGRELRASLIGPSRQEGEFIRRADAVVDPSCACYVGQSSLGTL